MKDYRVKIGVRNNRILSRIEACGFKSVAKFCKFFELSYGEVNKLVRMESSPLVSMNTNREDAGDYRKIVKLIAEGVGCLPEELFSEEQLNNVLEHSTAEREFSRAQLERLALGSDASIAIAEKNEMKHKLNNALNHLTDRERRVIMMRFGIGVTSDHTLSEVGDAFLTSRERVRQIEQKALRKLRLPEISDTLV